MDEWLDDDSEKWVEGNMEQELVQALGKLIPEPINHFVSRLLLGGLLGRLSRHS